MYSFTLTGKIIKGWIAVHQTCQKFYTIATASNNYYCTISSKKLTANIFAVSNTGAAVGSVG